MFDKVPANQRCLIPAIIKLSKELTASSITRVEQEQELRTIVAALKRKFAQSGSYRLHENREKVQFCMIVVDTLPKTGFVLVSDHP
jgi:type II secretory pathway component PulJ